MPIVFVELAPTVISKGEGPAEIPHFSQPFTMTPKGAIVLEQDSPADIQACVERVCLCPEGFREDLPAFGIPELGFSTVPLPLGDVKASCEHWEPRASIEISERAEGLTEADRVVRVEVTP